MNLSSLKWLREGGFDLLVESYCSTPITVQIRGYTENELIIHDHTTTSDRSLQSSVIGITGSPLYMTARSSVTGTKRGQCYVRVSLRIEGVVVATLFAGYVDDTASVAFPNGKIEDSKTGVGYIRSITGTDPAAGVEISETVPTGALWRLLSFKSTLTTDATVITRASVIEFTDGTNVVFRSSSGATQTASLANTETWALGVGVSITASGAARLAPLPDILLPAGYVIRTNCVSLQAGDNWSVPQLFVEEFMDP